VGTTEIRQYVAFTSTAFLSPISTTTDMNSAAIIGSVIAAALIVAFLATLVIALALWRRNRTADLKAQATT